MILHTTFETFRIQRVWVSDTISDAACVGFGYISDTLSDTAGGGVKTQDNVT